MSIDLMRGAVKKAYPGEGWKKKVDKMSSNQVLAVYSKLLDNKKIK